MKLFRLAASASIALAQSPDGRAAFQSRCSGCHGTDGNGGEHAPSILPTLATRNDEELGLIIRDGVPLKGMPAFKQLPETETRALVGFMRTLQQGRRRRGAPVRMRVRLTDGTEVEGFAIGRTAGNCSCAQMTSAFIYYASPAVSSTAA